MEPLISVIVPVYNVEKYLKKCIHSIINQTLKDIEIILVDDGSTDNSPKILDDYEKKDKRVKVIHKENGGQGSARNAGLDISRGKYIGFVDSDDWIDLNMYEELYKDIVKNNSDISVCSRKIFDENNNLNGKVELNNEVIDLSKFEIENYITKRLLFPHTVSACNKIYKNDILKNIRFKGVTEVGSEDTLFNYCVLFNVKTISSINTTYYNGLERSGSTARTYKLGAMIKTAKLMENIKDYSYKVGRNDVWEKVSPILFQFFQQWNINLIKKYSDNDIIGIISEELELASKNEVFNNCQKTLAFRTSYLKENGYKLTGRLYISLVMFLSYIKQYNLAAKLRCYR